MTITSKFDSTCPVCGMRIHAGERVEWNPGSKAQHVSCEPPAPVVADADDLAADEWRAHVAALPRLRVEDAGVYVLTDGSIVKMQANRDKTAVYPKLWREISGVRLAEDDSRPHGEYVYFDDWKARVELRERVEVSGRKMTLDEAKAFILRYGICCRCGRVLKDATSVERGIGPVCIKYFSDGMTGAELLGAA